MQQETVLLIHGLGRSRRAMRKLERALQAASYRVINLGYPSYRFSIEELANRYLIPEIERAHAQSERVHYITHSLGGILVRYVLANGEYPKSHRCVMLSPPNHGSEVAQTLKQSALVRFFMGPTLSQLGTDKESVPLQLPDFNLECAVITGSRSYEPWLSWLLTQPNDGKVSAQSAELPGKVFKVVPHNHTFIMRGDDVIADCLHFLKTGQLSE